MPTDPDNPFLGKLDLSEFGIEPSNFENVDLEERGRQYLADAKKRTAIARYNADCVRGYPESDWNHARLAPYRHAIDRVLAWQYGPKGILATGKTGRGKTRAIFALYRRLAVEEGRSVRYFYAGDWFTELQTFVHYGRDDARKWVEDLAATPIVILDDLGQEAVSKSRAEWAEAWFFRFLDIRIARALPLIVTTNLEAVDIAREFATNTNIRGNPLIRRLLDLCEVIKFEEKQ